MLSGVLKTGVGPVAGAMNFAQDLASVAQIAKLEVAQVVFFTEWGGPSLRRKKLPLAKLGAVGYRFRG